MLKFLCAAATVACSVSALRTKGGQQPPIQAQVSPQIFVRMPDGTPTTLDVDLDGTVLEVQRKMKDKLNMEITDATHFAFNLFGKPLDGTRSLKDQGVGQMSTLDCSARYPHIASFVEKSNKQVFVSSPHGDKLRPGNIHQILVKHPDGRNLILNGINKSTTIEEVKQKIHDKEGISSHKQRLIFEAKELQDGKTVQDYNIKTHSTLQLAFRLLGGKQVFVKAMDGKTYTLNVEDSDSIEDVKRKIQEQDGPAIQFQKLIYAGKELEDGMTLGHYGVGKESSMHLVERKSAGF